MYTINYSQRRTFSQFDSRHFLLYLSEQPVEYRPEIGEPAESSDPIEGYSYTGTMEDGGTLIAATEASYGAFVSGLIRLKYSADETEAIQANMLMAIHDNTHPRAEEFIQSWSDFQMYRDKCKAIAREVLDRVVS
jgi:hypothetical protein